MRIANCELDEVITIAYISITVLDFEYRNRSFDFIDLIRNEEQKQSAFCRKTKRKIHTSNVNPLLKFYWPAGNVRR